MSNVNTDRIALVQKIERARHEQNMFLWERLQLTPNVAALHAWHSKRADYVRLYFSSGISEAAKDEAISGFEQCNEQIKQLLNI